MTCVRGSACGHPCLGIQTVLLYLVGGLFLESCLVKSTLSVGLYGANDKLSVSRFHFVCFLEHIHISQWVKLVTRSAFTISKMADWYVAWGYTAAQYRQAAIRCKIIIFIGPTSLQSSYQTFHRRNQANYRSLPHNPHLVNHNRFSSRWGEEAELTITQFLLYSLLITYCVFSNFLWCLYEYRCLRW